MIMKVGTDPASGIHEPLQHRLDLDVRSLLKRNVLLVMAELDSVSHDDVILAGRKRHGEIATLAVPLVLATMGPHRRSKVHRWSALACEKLGFARNTAARFIRDGEADARGHLQFLHERQRFAGSETEHLFHRGPS